MKNFIAVAALVGVAGLFAGCCNDPCSPCCPTPVYQSPCCPAPSGGISGTPGKAAPTPAGVGSGPGQSCGGGGKSCG